jgi:hypothetical protein
MYLSAGVGDTDVAARVTFLSELAGEKFIEFGAENTVGDELALFADLGGHFVVWRDSKRRNRNKIDWNIYLEGAEPRRNELASKMILSQNYAADPVIM